MNIRDILEGCQHDEIALALTDDGSIRYRGSDYAVSYWLPILAKHKAQLIEALTPEVKPAIVASNCMTCRHLASPGLSAGYCGQRSDLPPAYGINHPLRRLPADNGESCHEYDAEDWVRHER